MSSPHPVFLDCDTGIDDALALAYLLASPGVDLVGVGTVSGNIDSARSARNTLDVLALAGRAQPPVAIGAHDALAAGFHGGSARVHGSNGIGGVQLPQAAAEPVDLDAATLLVNLAHEHSGRLDLVATGPLTNLALALRLDPELPRHIRRVTAMGGSALAPGNVQPVAEANIWHDPEAAQEVLDADWNLTLVPLDVTLEHRLTEADTEALAASDHPLNRALAQMLEHYLDFYVGVYGFRTCALHDPLAAGIATGAAIPSLAPRVPVEVDTTDGPGRGQTICDLRRRRIAFRDQTGDVARVVLTVDEPFGPQLMQRLLGYAAP